MSDSSYNLSSDGPGVAYCLSQSHQPLYDEYRKSHHKETMPQRMDGTRKRPRTASPTEYPPVKQENSSPCITPRPSALKAADKISEQYNAALNSQMGENTFVDYLLEKTGAIPPQLTKVDETDIDLLQMRCSDAEAQRDDALEERDRVLEQLTNLRVSLYQALDERNQAMQQVAEWRRAAIGARSLVELVAKQLDD